MRTLRIRAGDRALLGGIASAPQAGQMPAEVLDVRARILASAMAVLPVLVAFFEFGRRWH
ncbi:MAG: hypothetical protein ACSLFN_04985 [Candidatus Limnocylindrales bacterium]